MMSLPVFDPHLLKEYEGLDFSIVSEQLKVGF